MLRVNWRHPNSNARARDAAAGSGTCSRTSIAVAPSPLCRAARACHAPGVATQGHVLRPADFAATLTVEAAVHFLDLTVALPGAPPPAPGPLALVHRVLDGLLGHPLPAAWDAVSSALKGTGRVTLTGADRAVLGADAERFPLFG